MMNSIIPIGNFGLEFEPVDHDCSLAEIRFSPEEFGAVLFLDEESGEPLGELLSEDEKADLLGWLIRYFAHLSKESASFYISPMECRDDAARILIGTAQSDIYSRDFSDAAVATYTAMLTAKITIVSRSEVRAQCAYCPNRATCDNYLEPDASCFDSISS